MMKLVRKINAAFDVLLNALIVIAVIMLVFATLSVCAEVAMRYFFNMPIKWVVEVSEWILLFITFLGAAWVLKREGHVSMDLLVTRINPRASALLHSVTSLICCVTCLIVAWFGTATALDTYARGVRTYGLLELPVYPLAIIISFGSYLLVIQFLRRAYGYLRAFLKPESPEKEKP